MSKPTVIVFDLGKVLLDFDYGLAVERLLKRSTINATELQRLIDQSSLLLRYERGNLSSREFFVEIREASGFDGDFDDFETLFSDIFWEIPEMIDLHRELRIKGNRAYVFSNTNEFAVNHVRRKFPFFADFDGRILSFEHNAMKPEAKLYEVVEAKAGCRGDTILYLDDRLENVEAGKARGWQVIHHTSPAQSRQVIEELELL